MNKYSERLREVERARDVLGRRIEDVQIALNECGAGFTGQTESMRIRALRSRLSRYETVVEALRALLPDYAAAVSMLDTEDEESAESRALLESARDALRALDDSATNTATHER